MASREKIRTAVAIATVAAVISVVASVALLRRRQRRRSAAAKLRRRCSEIEDKPQNRFKRVLADNSYSPFKHLKREGQAQESLKVHPYEDEITSLLDNPPTLSNFASNHKCPDMDALHSWIDTEAQLELLAKLLSREKVFAVDTEQHGFRSFLGYTALMQISTQTEDYLIDTIALHDVMGILRSVFADPSICKVFHGADNDVIWLQRDFHVYVVNMFDTAKACEILSKPQKSLAYLLETYCGVMTNKSLQREDWRLRPLSKEMIEYARCDAHYLLYIADCLTSELHGKSSDTSACLDDMFNFVFEASRRSNTVCMQLYAKEIEPTPGVSAASSIVSRHLHDQGFDSGKSCESKDLVWKLCAWRDLMARIHDESLRYVLSDHAIAALATKAPENSTEVCNVIIEADLQNISSNICSSLPSPSPIVVTHIEELSCLLQNMIVSIDDVFKSYLKKPRDSGGCCSLSIYNYALISQLSSKSVNTFSFTSSGEKLMATTGKKASRELFIKKFSCKSPVYHNCRIYASDGRLLCYCDRKKLEWYLQRNLAKNVEDNPLAIMLLFEPKGRPEDEDNDFYIQSKKNICVGCGEKNHYIRYRIIPSCYRMHFPEHLKSHRSHDIVLLCVDCHEVAHAAAERHKKQIAEEFEIPLFVQKIIDMGNKDLVAIESVPDGETNETGVSPLRLRTAAMALLRHGSRMPLKRHEELMQIVKAYYGGREVTQKDLELALLVGMNPHERRRLEKKKGLSFRNVGRGLLEKDDCCTDPDDVNYAAENCHTVTQELLRDQVSDSNGEGKDPSSANRDPRLPLHKDTSSEHADASSFVSDLESFDRRETPEKVDTRTYMNGTENENLYRDNGLVNSYRVNSFESDKRLSLLGHGPHGKQVVEHLLVNYGEEGIRQFCQRWRQVFVEALHPRFLPAAWNIKHSGRRDFGEHSVYNPAKKPPQAVNGS